SQRRAYHSATLLTSGDVLIAGGKDTTSTRVLSSCEMSYISPGYDSILKPLIDYIPSSADTGEIITITGSGFKGFSESSGGGNSSMNSATNYPIVIMRRTSSSLGDGHMITLEPPDVSTWDTASVTVQLPFSGYALPSGYYLLWVSANGVPSLSKTIKINSHISTGVDEVSSIRKRLIKVKIYPNPSMGNIRIDYVLDKVGEVDVEIYNLIGQKVAHLISGQKQEGRHTVIWDGRDVKGRRCSPGIYFCRIDAFGESLYNRITLLRRI
ncbi:T9SS type A sorting domain-containing protein, partial [candidate division WOR-3 bacterium]|nr:T9SS type A sorting domain-containing protein [candidate division WOR-3 bacterium]